MERIQVENFGPIRQADITFGDVTVLVGPQASGKSLFVQLVKAVEDAGAIRKELKHYGFDWLHGKDVARDFSSIYFGGALADVVTDKTVIRCDGKLHYYEKVAKPPGRASQDDTVFVIPAQRVMVLQDGWPRPYMGYSANDSYCVQSLANRFDC